VRLLEENGGRELLKEKMLAWWYCERRAQQGEREGRYVWQEDAVLRIEECSQDYGKVVSNNFD
jgi:hypothetical protein